MDAINQPLLDVRDLSVALMLSLLVFVGEAVRDAFDPRRTFA